MNKLLSYALLIGALTVGCKKTQVVPYDAEAANHIAEYKVTNATETLYGVVDDLDNTITVYIPYYISIDYIVPKITLQDGATLLDSTGGSIDTREDLEPVAIGRVGYTYKVKDDKNAIRQYTLVTKIVPYKDKLKMGYMLTRDANDNYIADTTIEKEAIVNSRFYIYGNLESSSKNARLTLVSKKTNTAVANALTVYEVGRNTETHYIGIDISPNVDSGNYYIVVEHQGRIDTMPTIHMNYKKPFFGFLPRPVTQGDTVTLTVNGPGNYADVYSGVNLGVRRAYILINSQTLITKPSNFPAELYDTPIELEIFSQTRTSIKFRFPATIPAGIYETNMSLGSSIYDGYTINSTGFGIYFDFNDTGWGNANLLSGLPYSSYEIKAKN